MRDGGGCGGEGVGDEAQHPEAQQLRSRALRGMVTIEDGGRVWGTGPRGTVTKRRGTQRHGNYGWGGVCFTDGLDVHDEHVALARRTCTHALTIITIDLV